MLTNAGVNQKFEVVQKEHVDKTSRLYIHNSPMKYVKYFLSLLLCSSF